MEKISIKMNGETYQVDKFTTISQFLAEVLPKEDRFRYVLATRNKKLSELGVLLDGDCELELLGKDSVMGMDTYKRSLTLLMVKAFSDVLGGKTNHRVEVMYPVSKGVFCRLCNTDVKVTDALIENVKARMEELAYLDVKIVKESIGTDEAVRRFVKQGMTDKEKLFKYRRVSKANLYSLDGYEDYFYGYMVPSTGYLKVFDIVPHDEGFILVPPKKDKPDEVPELEIPERLFGVLKGTEEWYRKLGVNNVGELNETITTGEIKELMLVQEALQEKQIAEIAERIKETGKRIVLVAGPTSSGKTTFSHRLSVQLRAHGLRPYPFALDNYFLEREDTPRDENGNYDFECLEAMDLNLFNKHVTALLSGEEVSIPTFNFTLGKKEYKGNKLKLGPTDVLVAEGIHALNPAMTSSIPDESKFKVYISALTQLNIDDHNRIPTTDGRLIRRIVRDARCRGNSAQDTIAMWQSVRRGEDRFIFPFQEQADAMFNSALIYELSVIKQFAEPLLFAVPRDSYEYYEAKRLLKFMDYFVGLDVTNVPMNSILREFVGGSCFE